MAIFKVKVIQEKVWRELNEGTAYIEAGSLEQAQKRAKKINRAIRHAEYDDAEFSGVDFDEGETVLININDFAEGNEDFTTNAEELKKLSDTIDDCNYELELNHIEEAIDIDKSKIIILDVPY